MVLGGKSDSKGPTLLKIGDKWVNVEIWKRSHPGGAAPLERYSGQDCTDAFLALHSKEAIEQVVRMKAVDVPRDVEQRCEKPSALTLAFRKWRDQLEADGYFERRWHVDAFYISLMLCWMAVGYALVERSQPLAVLFLGFGMQQAGWIGHDYAHARGGAGWWIGRLCAGLINAFSPEWWSEKHNTHHVHPNQVGIDTDIANDPVLHLFVPDSADKDHPFRPYQHWYYHLAYAFLYASWRMQSFLHAWRRRDYFELGIMAVNYAWLATLPLAVSLGAVLFGGSVSTRLIVVVDFSLVFLFFPRPVFSLSRSH